MPRIAAMTERGDMKVDMLKVGLEEVPERLFFWTTDGAPVDLTNWYRGKSCFLLCTGPSLITHDLSLLTKRGILTMGVNNGWAVFKPNLWIANDAPGRMHDVGWKDPSIIKFTPAEHIDTRLKVRNPDGTFKWSSFTVKQMPSVFTFIRNQKFEPSTFLRGGAVNFGRSIKYHDDIRESGLSSMLQPFRILHHLGIKTIYLLGCDFKMTGTAPQNPGNYAFPQDRTERAVQNNQKMFRMLNWMFADLQPIFKLAGLSVFNCTPDSGLAAFPHMPYEEAIAKASEECGKEMNTDGWYSNERNPT